MPSSEELAGTRALARWCLARRGAEIDTEIAAQAKLLILDAVGCALAASRDAAAGQATVRVVARSGGAPECTVIGMEERTSLTNAVLANGHLVRALDLNDFYAGPGLLGHPSDNIPVALAVAEQADASGQAVLGSVVMGYELYCRLLDLMDPTGRWDHVTATGLAAPAMAGVLLGLSEDHLANALALGLLWAPTLAAVRSGQLSAAKGLANAVVAQLGVQATLLAANGISGPSEIMESAAGLRALLPAKAPLDRLMRSEEARPRLMEASLKPYPCIGTAQSVVAAALLARERLRGAVLDLSRIEIQACDAPLVRLHIGDTARQRPSTRETADHSLHYLVAVALLEGEVTPRQLDDRRWEDPRVVALMRRVEVRVASDLGPGGPQDLACRLVLHPAFGEPTVAEMPFAPGHPNNRLTPAQVAAKFAAGAEGTLARPDAEAVVEEIMAIERRPSIRPLMHRLRRRSPDRPGTAAVGAVAERTGRPDPRRSA